MRNLIIIFFTLLMIGCNEDEPYTIKGYVEGKDSGIVRLSQYGESRMDSKECQLVNGEFIFQGNIQFPEQFILIYEESGPQSTFEAFSIFLEPSANVNVILFSDSISKSQITGSKLANEFSEINHLLKTNFTSQLNDLATEYEKAIVSEDKDLQKIIFSKGDSIQNEILKWKLNFIEYNPKSFISAYFLHSIYLMQNIDTVIKYYGMLDFSLEETKYVNRVESFLSVLPGKPFQDFELYDGLRNLYKLSTISENKVVLIDFWASWCKPCREQNKKLASLYESYKSKGFEIVGVSIDRDTVAFLNTIREDKMTWINLIDRTDETAVHKTYRSMNIPSNVLINKSGLITHKDIKLEDLESTIESLLKE